MPDAIGYAVLVLDDVFNAMRNLQLDLRERYGRSAGLRQPPHITVKAPFITPAHDRHRRYLDALAARTAPFEIELDGIAFFEEPGAVAYLDVAQPNSELKSLTETILRDLGPEAAPSPYEAAGTVRDRGPRRAP
jgi:2'-5' RNA ligase